MHIAINGIKATSFSKYRGFTIVELLIVIVVIAILAAITVVAYSGIQKRADASAVTSKGTQAKKALEAYKIQNDDTYPANQNTFNALVSQKSGDKHYVSYVSTPPYSHYAISVAPGEGPHSDGVVMQTVTNATCPITRIRANDARDNRSYWIQKQLDGNCWMLTNLAYAGGGSNTYGDTKQLLNGTTDTANTRTEAKYYIPAEANATTGTTNPSTSTNGSGQYGYFYNWCAASGVQAGTRGCLDASTPEHDPLISICPAGWRLPTGGADGEYDNLLLALGVTSSSAGTTLLQNTWLAQRIGSWNMGFSTTGVFGSYWTSTYSTGNAARRLTFGETYVLNGAYDKGLGFAVRCIISE